MCDYHLNDRQHFCIIKFKFVVHMREYSPLGTKCIFRVSLARARDFSTPCTNSKSLKKPDEFMKTEMSKFATQRQ